MDASTYYEIGNLGKPFGIRGEIHLWLDVDQPEKYLHLKTVYIEAEHTPIPYTIKNLRRNSAFVFIVKLEHINDCDTAEKWFGKRVFLPISQLPTLNENQFYYHEIIGCTLQDTKYGTIGTVERVWELPVHDLIVFKHGSVEVLLPIIDSFIGKFDRQTNILYTSIPDGLLDIYTNANEQVDEEAEID